MRVVDETRRPETVKFSDLVGGAPFLLPKHGVTLFLKLDPTWLLKLAGMTRNAIYAHNCYPCFVNEDAEVYPVQGAFVVGYPEGD